MESQNKEKTEKPIIAICYDFDKTLSPDDMQAQGYIQSVQDKSDSNDVIGDFWNESNGLAQENDMDQNLAYMFTMKNKAEGQIIFNKNTLNEYGSKVKLFNGVEDWFERIKLYGEKRGVIIEHYIISSGLKEMIEGTSIAKNNVFKKIYATSFYYNDKGLAVWPAQVVNYTNKTQFLYRISKGVLDVNNPAVNDYFKPEEIRVPFRNMVYIGDSDTDIPCMKLVNSHGGYSIGVYNPEKNDKNKVYKMIRDARIGYFSAADYSEGTELDELLKLIIDKTVYNEKLENKHYENKEEAQNDYINKESNEQEKLDLIDSLKGSQVFKNTYNIIDKLNKYMDWSDEEVAKLLTIGFDNSSVRYVLGHDSVKDFYKNLLSNRDIDGIYNMYFKDSALPREEYDKLINVIRNN